MIITSKTNNTIKYISSLKNKKYRNKYNKYVIEGIKLVEEIINSEGNAPEFIVYSKGILNKSSLGIEFLDKYKDTILKQNNVVSVPEEIFKYVTDVESPQGILAVIDKDNEYTISDLEKHLIINSTNNEKYIILDKIQDPGNLGTIIRSAVSFGIRNIICTEGTVDAFSPKVIRSTMSGIRKVKIYNIANDEIDKMINILNKEKYNVIATSLMAEKYVNAQDISSKDIFVMGNEANGVSDILLRKCNKQVKIPMENTMESLNVGIATAILMYEQYLKEMK